MFGFLRSRRASAAPPTETRADPSWAALSGASGDYAALLAAGDGSGLFPRAGFLDGRDLRPPITPRLAENYATVCAAVGAIAGAVASLPAYVFRFTSAGREEDPSHPVARLIREGPNENQTWPEFVEWLLAQTLLNGNGLAEIVADGAGRVVALRPAPWPRVTVRRLDSGRLVYDVAPDDAIGGPARRLLDTEVLHLRDRSDDGLVGRSRLSRAAPVVRAALTQDAYGEFLYDNRAAPSGLISFENPLSPNQRDQIRTAVRESWQGARNAGRVMVLDSGARYTPFAITPENLEMLAARRFSTEEIARIHQVPPPIIGIWDHSTFTNSETAGRWFAQFTLGPWIRKLEEAFRRAVFSSASRRDHAIEFDLSGFLRGDAEARWRAHEIAVRNGILTPNEVREVEGWNPRPELDAPSNPAESVR
ncbi:MAG: phage portal protein [Amphiplicatus sp.]